ncbi:Respiratory-chain NADH dehydrogenase 51 Kd subunit [Marvinbryantia formatexigens DSM 14469]|uniref:Respiratory-chain NADH dehydrogenase 51 Kd subunit n=1 Tax=Marvinbryantia formatexigens DSM 14469 TaxID=478749 RepID=C6LEW4_9FIRM|nr:4Fe-4S dicluster domain-containing protein [Marvinbryantia formatexigens]EET60703.1 Respiratory-chain NADH dehydrogenase 51 Kd subunit [Marvinbryantia formatexigens DSM 14469]UWO23003.1 4Fe-4S dicluster domain-containing protein [Marvinbryantia formatexigens DSM 14469]SDG35163.1 Na+-translocating ferredoxin:NAD+ oxidoreductase RNF, RnfC subunit [Marvinbryantia formatexigens]
MNLIETVKAAGVVGAGGAGFPTHVKLNTKVEYFIVNAAECEPLIETDKYLCRTWAERIVRTIPVIADFLGASKKVIALKAKYEREIAALKQAVETCGSDVEIFGLGYFYPAGDEQTLIQQVTGRSVPERGLPSDVGCVVDNVGTVLNIADALEGKPVTEKYLSVVGEVRQTLLLRVPVGTPVLECVKEAQPLISDYALIMGGPMMGKQLTERTAMEAAVVTKTTGNIMVLPKEHYLFKRAALPMETIKRQTRSACIQCRMCTDLCPRYLIGHQMRPNLVMRNLWREETAKDDEEFLKMFGDAANCCSCGVCEMFACPMGLSPRKVNEYMKGELRKRGIQVPKNPEAHAREFVDERKTPTNRLVARLDLSKYYGKHPQECRELYPETVFIPFSQHIGKPAETVKKAGDTVARGELLAAAAEGLSANIHSSVDGVVEEITEKGARIRCGKE